MSGPPGLTSFAAGILVNAPCQDLMGHGFKRKNARTGCGRAPMFRGQMKKRAEKTKSAAMELLARVGKLAKQGSSQKDMAKALGFKTTITLQSRLLAASQITRKPIPVFRARRGTGKVERIEFVEVRRRGPGASFGVNIPQEPLRRAGVHPGHRLTVKVRGKTLFLRPQES